MAEDIITNTMDGPGEVGIVVEQRFERTADGAVWGPAVFSRSFWARYLEVFDRVIVIARVGDVITCSAGLQRCNGDAVEFLALPYYVGPVGFLGNRHTIR